MLKKASAKKKKTLIRKKGKKYQLLITPEQLSELYDVLEYACDWHSPIAAKIYRDLVKLKLRFPKLMRVYCGGNGPYPG